MKIKLLIGITGYASVPSYEPGAILEVTLAPHYAVNNPKWFITESKVGVYAYEAEEVTEKPDYEDEEAQNTEVPVLQNEDGQSIVVAGRSVPYIIRDRGDMDVPMLPAQPTRQADEDAERLIGLFPYLSDEDAIWLRDTLLGWLNSLLYRGALLGYSNESLTAVRDALDAMQL